MPTTWNPANKSAAITLSGGDLIASNISGGNGNFSGLATIGYDVTSAVGRAVQFNTGASVAANSRCGLAIVTHTTSNLIGVTGQTGYALVFGATAFRGPNNGVITGQVNIADSAKVLFLFQSGALYVYYDVAGTWTPAKTGVNAEAGTGGVWTGLTGTLYPIGSPQQNGSSITLQPVPDNMSQFPSYLGWDDLPVVAASGLTPGANINTAFSGQGSVIGLQPGANINTAFQLGG
jgi:hypothetical protein